MDELPITPPLPSSGDEAELLGLTRLDGRNREEVLAAANRLEGVFVSMLMEEMRRGLGDGGLFGEGTGSDVYGGMFDRMMGEELSRRGGLGIAEMVVRSLVGEEDPETAISREDPPAKTETSEE